MFKRLTSKERVLNRKPDIKNGILGLFPSPGHVGGVQASGKVAWKGIVEHSESGHAHLFCYGERNGLTGEHWFLPSVQASSRVAAVLAAWRFRQQVRCVLVWHHSLLKLLPFLRPKDASIVLFLHGVEIWGRQNKGSGTLLRRVDLFLSNSNYTWQCLLKERPDLVGAPHQTVHLGIGSPLRESVVTKPNVPVALMISRLIRSENYKGHREMINAWPLVLERIPEAELWIVGEGDFKEDLERLAARRGLAGKVRFWGQVSEDEKVQLLLRSRCLALPSRGEGFGLVYLEAMRLGRPCLVSTVDAGREVVNPPEAGLAVDPGNEEAIAAALCRLLADSTEWQTWSRQARHRYENHFTARHFQERLIAALAI